MHPVTNSDFLLDRLLTELINEVRELRKEVSSLKETKESPKPTRKKKGEE